MNFLLIFLLFLIWRVFDFLILYFAPKFIPYLGFFPYKELLNNFHLPTWVTSLANFDGLHYILIARQGYSQYEQAFFPLYPLLIRLLTPVINNSLLVGLLISNVSFLLGLLIASKLFNLKSAWFFVLLLAFPTSFFFGVVYTEGLFFLLFILALYFLKKKNYLLAGLFAILTSLTRLIGVFLIIPIIFHWLSVSFRAKSRNLNRSFDSSLRSSLRMTLERILTLLSPLIGLAIYCFYLFKTTGDPFFFLTSQPIFGANRSSHLILLPQVYWRYFKIFFTANWDFRYFVSVIEFLIFNFVFIILILDLFKIIKIKIKGLTDYGLRLPAGKAGITDYNRLGLSLFSFANLLLPTLTGTFSFIPRYVLFSLSFFIFLSQIKNTVVRNFILLISLIFHIFLLGFFSQGYFVS